ncbi:DNA-directed RNA polymerase subunit alpha C-terminal domain-containing protein [Brevibacillus porteri]|uniref:RNA polymerase alpha subunit C-terminal domain-containing protein n=1 Tax=Brevibacillus porteri TaxID=2126350 RepID=A0ABX5FHV7_9BACL|nr:DNA-directed RNA polymerase subunit alpha C-terminal domain-containing protein [Brevibacillus porteri]MED1801701.1 DNA-directed RNA polymerase subunit alpha C-terminal domain-containing protein [Brevibacillus porteri]MED2135279.1 DNA-directed RNA polymerase subunit alpha C-terminal domain-containing protein [Brevibacillus porteri]MED2748008.1 DNA-directed RNA polymerase subunit alpha C-terminal domain-containing protein [Brevibacillus porteri]MED2813749.1 DNA-directed RNA polymerase subunit 
MNKLFVAIMGVNEASELWELSNTIIRELCKSGKIVATPIDDTWAILRDQPAETLQLIEDARKKESLYHIAAASPDEPIINFIKDDTLSLEQSIEAIFMHTPGPLSTRAANSLRRVGISTVKRLVESTFNQLWPIRNLGNRALMHTLHALKQAAENPSLL